MGRCQDAAVAAVRATPEPEQHDVARQGATVERGGVRPAFEGEQSLTAWER